MGRIKETSRKGYFTGRKVYSKDLNKSVLVGKISGWNGNGVPIYDLFNDDVKCGEMSAEFIKKNTTSKR